MKLIYEEKEQKEIITCGIIKFDELLEGIDLDDSSVKKKEVFEFFHLLFIMAMLFKNPSYKEEKEWRFIRFYPKSGDVKKIKHRTARHTLIPYFELDFSCEYKGRMPIVEIMFGSKQDSIKSEIALKKLFIQKCYDEFPLFTKSSIPYV